MVMPTRFLKLLKHLLPLTLCMVGCRVEEKTLRGDKDFPPSDIRSVVLRSGVEYTFNTSLQWGEVVTPWSVDGRTRDGHDVRIPDTMIAEVRTRAPLTLDRSEIGTRPISEIVMKKDSTVKRFDEEGGRLNAQYGRVIGTWITGGAVAFRADDILEFRTGEPSIMPLDSVSAGKVTSISEIILRQGRLVQFDSLGVRIFRGEKVLRGRLENGAFQDVPLDSIWYVRASQKNAM